MVEYSSSAERLETGSQDLLLRGIYGTNWDFPSTIWSHPHLRALL